MTSHSKPPQTTDDPSREDSSPGDAIKKEVHSDELLVGDEVWDDADIFDEDVFMDDPFFADEFGEQGPQDPPPSPPPIHSSENDATRVQSITELFSAEMTRTESQPRPQRVQEPTQVGPPPAPISLTTKPPLPTHAPITLEPRDLNLPMRTLTETTDDLLERQLLPYPWGTYIGELIEEVHASHDPKRRALLLHETASTLRMHSPQWIVMAFELDRHALSFVPTYSPSLWALCAACLAARDPQRAEMFLAEAIAAIPDNSPEKISLIHMSALMAESAQNAPRAYAMYAQTPRSSVETLLRICRVADASKAYEAWSEALQHETSVSILTQCARNAWSRGAYEAAHASALRAHAEQVTPDTQKTLLIAAWLTRSHEVEHRILSALEGNLETLACAFSTPDALDIDVHHTLQDAHCARLYMLLAHQRNRTPHQTLPLLLKHLSDPTLHAAWLTPYAAQSDETISELLRLIDLSDSSAPRLLLGQYALRNARYDLLLRTRPLPKEPKHPDEEHTYARALFRRAEIQLHLLKDLDSACNTFLDILHVDPNHTPSLYALSSLLAQPYHPAHSTPHHPRKTQRRALFTHLETHDLPPLRSLLHSAYIDCEASISLHALQEHPPTFQPQRKLAALQSVLREDPEAPDALHTFLKTPNLPPQTLRRALLWSAANSNVPTPSNPALLQLLTTAPELVYALPKHSAPSLEDLLKHALPSPSLQHTAHTHVARFALNPILSQHDPSPLLTAPPPPFVGELRALDTKDMQGLVALLTAQLHDAALDSHTRLRAGLLAADLQRDQIRDEYAALDTLQHILTLDPANLRALRTVLALLHQNQEFVRLDQHLQHWISLLPEDPHPTRHHLLQARAYILETHLNQAAQALAIHTDLLAHLTISSPQHALSLFCATRLHLLHSAPSIAQLWLQRLAQSLQNPSVAIELLLFAASFERNHDLSPRQSFQAILSLEPRHPQALRGLEHTLLVERDLIACANLYRETLRDTTHETPEKEAIRFKYAKILALQDQYDAAADLLLDTLEHNPSHIPSLLLLSEVQRALHLWADALTTETTLQSLAPSNVLRAHHLYMRATLLQDHLEQADIAQPLLVQLLDLDPTHTQGFERLYALFETSPTHRDDLARLIAARAEVSPDEEQPALLRRAASLCSEPLESRALLLRALSLDPEHPDTLQALASICAAFHEPQQALGYLHTLLALRPTSSVLFQIASLYASIENRQEALGHLQTLLQTEPHHEDALNLLVHVQRTSSEFEKAGETALLLFEVAPTGPNALQVATLYAHDLERPHRAAPWLLTALDLDPMDITPLRVFFESENALYVKLRETRLSAHRATLHARLREDPWNFKAINALCALDHLTGDTQRARLLETVLAAFGEPFSTPVHSVSTSDTSAKKGLTRREEESALESAQHEVFALLAPLLLQTQPDPISPHLLFLHASAHPPQLEYILKAYALEDTVQILEHTTDPNAVYTLFTPHPTLVLGSAVLSSLQDPTHLFFIGFALEALRDCKAILQRPTTPAFLAACNALLHDMFGALLPASLFPEHPKPKDLEHLKTFLTPQLRRDLLRALHLPSASFDQWKHWALVRCLQNATLLCGDFSVALQRAAPLLSPFSSSPALHAVHTYLVSTPPSARTSAEVLDLLQQTPLFNRILQDLVRWLTQGPLHSPPVHTLEAPS